MSGDLEEAVNDSLHEFLHARLQDPSICPDVIGFLASAVSHFEIPQNHAESDSFDYPPTWKAELVELMHTYFPESIEWPNDSCDMLLQHVYELKVDSIIHDDTPAIAPMSFTPSLSAPFPEKQSSNDKDPSSPLRKRILDKYALIEFIDGQEVHASSPVNTSDMRKTKLVRFRDDRIVSTKGEKAIVERDLEEEERMKHTYVSIRPQRRYRFH